VPHFLRFRGVRPPLGRWVSGHLALGANAWFVAKRLFRASRATPLEGYFNSHLLLFAPEKATVCFNARNLGESWVGTIPSRFFREHYNRAIRKISSTDSVSGYQEPILPDDILAKWTGPAWLCRSRCAPRSSIHQFMEKVAANSPHPSSSRAETGKYIFKKAIEPSLPDEHSASTEARVSQFPWGNGSGRKLREISGENDFWSPTMEFWILISSGKSGKQHQNGHYDRSQQPLGGLDVPQVERDLCGLERTDERHCGICEPGRTINPAGIKKPCFAAFGVARRIRPASAGPDSVSLAVAAAGTSSKSQPFLEFASPPTPNS